MKKKHSVIKKPHQEQLPDSERELFLNAFYQGHDPAIAEEKKPNLPIKRDQSLKSQDISEDEQALFLQAFEQGTPLLAKPAKDLPKKLGHKKSQKRGIIDATLDLHGHVVEDAALLLRKFIDREKQYGSKTLLIIHGKGSGILKQAVWAIVETHPAVDDFQVAPGKFGGEGALVVRINRHAKRLKI